MKNSFNNKGAERAHHQSHQCACHSQKFEEQSAFQSGLVEHSEFEIHHLSKCRYSLCGHEK